MSRDRTCRKCGALPGKPCLTPGGKLAPADHDARGWEHARSPVQMAGQRRRNARYRESHRRSA